MEKVLNRGLNFLILPKKLDITQVLVDWNKFERTMIWTEWWHGHKPQNVGTCYKMKYMDINVPPSQDFIEAKELKS